MATRFQTISSLSGQAGSATFFTWQRVASAALLCLALSACGGGSNQATAPVVDRAAPNFALGTGNVGHAELAVPRPGGTPCSVVLFQDMSFNNFSSRPFNYAVSCPGPWQKVVLEADFSVNAGRQFDRTGHISLAGVNLYTGTTQEPSASVGPNWHVERDVTDYAPLFVNAATGSVDLDNLVNDTYTGVLKGSARLVFYPLQDVASKPRTADMVLPLSARTDGRPDVLDDGHRSLSKTITFPRNVIRAYLDVLAQGQGDDEFWWSCAPDNLADTLQTCSGTALREVEVSIDDQPAGAAPVYPWIFTGGVNPRLWRPVPSVQTLNMLPQRIDLSPFAGVLSDGAPHKVSVSVFNVRNSFNLTANLLLFRDPGAAVVTGAIVQNSLTAPLAPMVNSTIANTATGPAGKLDIITGRTFRIAGTVSGSQGVENLSVEQQMFFDNTQDYDAVNNNFLQNMQMYTISAVANGNVSASVRRDITFPLQFNIKSDGTNTSFQVDQSLEEKQSYQFQGQPVYLSRRYNHVLSRTDSPAVNGRTSFSSQQVGVYDELGNCYNRTVNSQNGLLVSAIDAAPCVATKVTGKPFGKINSPALDLWLTLGNVN